MTGQDLPGLDGHNPLGYLAALGLLDVLTRQQPERQPRLAWTRGLRPVAVVSWDTPPVAPEIDALVDVIDLDRQAVWRLSALLDVDADDIKPDASTLREWFRMIAANGVEADRRLVQALLAEGAFAGNGNEAKPTHLHFTAGQQRLLRMVRELRDQVQGADVREALQGPWRNASSLPSLGWDARGQRVYAVSGFDPAKEKRLSVPGAEWLAFLGLRFFPVANDGGTLLTTGCDRGWKRGSFRWPLWGPPLSADTVMSLIGSGSLAPGSRVSIAALTAWGVHEVVTAPIKRTDQGGYGSFGPPSSSVAETGSATSSLLRRAPRRWIRQVEQT